MFFVLWSLHRRLTDHLVILEVMPSNMDVANCTFFLLHIVTSIDLKHTRISKDYAGAPKVTMPAWTQDRLDVQHKKKREKKFRLMTADMVSNNAE